VSHTVLSGKSDADIFHIIDRLKNKSIYDSGRLAQPDEVWNFERGDGAEKAFLMANALIYNDPYIKISITLNDGNAILHFNGKKYRFVTSKGHSCRILMSGGDYSVA
jgi:hypothetical protein